MAIKQTARPSQVSRPAPRPPRPPVARGGSARARLLGRLRFKAPSFTFGREVIAELRKVTWPSVQQTRELTIVVIVLSAVVGALLGGIDWLFSKLVEYLLLNPIF
ncbi:MAG: preprotein translocase subunit SecE [Chloroflexi bacterium]|nr:preprotein translocase subunit SecE [Chloroflexota bacterium]GIW11763.1 MAG: hypothetical protein KatS3mg061_2820 [Dehalococcoidia bacterium]